MHPLEVDLDAWEPWSPAEVAERLREVPAPWYVLAGWALDLSLGRRTRAHDDIEIGVPSDRWPEIQSALEDCELVVVGEGRAWPLTEESLREHRQTWVREPGSPWRLDVIREQWEDGTWVFRRDARIRVDGARAIATTADGIPFLRPEIVLLFKAKTVREKDRLDFEAVLPALEPGARTWLREALQVVHPGHPWLAELS